jgi:hypothetical protein
MVQQQCFYLNILLSIVYDTFTYIRPFILFNVLLPINLNEMGSHGVKVKGKAVPLQAWSGPEGSRKLRFPDYMTKAQDGGKFVSLTHRPPLSPGNAPGTHFC